MPFEGPGWGLTVGAGQAHPEVEAGPGDLPWLHCTQTPLTAFSLLPLPLTGRRLPGGALSE